MIVYKDRISGDELFSDSFPVKLIDGLYYEVEGKRCLYIVDYDGNTVKCKEEYFTIVVAIVTGEVSKVCVAVFAVNTLKEQLTKCFEKEVKEEVSRIYGRSFVNNFHASKLSDLKSFSYEEQEKELLHNCPVLYRMVTAAAIKEKNMKRNTTKNTGNIRKSVLSGIGIILNARNQNLNVHQMYTSMILSRGGANKMTFRRLAARGLCFSYYTTLKNQSSLAKNYDIKLLQRKEKVEADNKSNKNNKELEQNNAANTTNDGPVETPISCNNEAVVNEGETVSTEIAISDNSNDEVIPQTDAQMHEETTTSEKDGTTSIVSDYGQYGRPFDADGIGFRFVGDNVNVRTSPRHMGKGREVTQFDLFNFIAVENRVPFEESADCKQLITHIPPHLASKQLCNFVPDGNDNRELRQYFKFLIANTIRKYIPALDWLVQHIPSHMNNYFTKYTTSKSNKTVAENSGGIDDSLIGGNKSAEEPAAEEYSSDATYGCNIIFNHRLQPAAAISKKDYGTIIKPYVKKIHDFLVEDDKKDEAARFKNGIPDVVKKLKGMWNDLVPYTGESCNPDGMTCFLNYRENGDPYMIFFKHGLTEEKFVSFSSY